MERWGSRKRYSSRTASWDFSTASTTKGLEVAITRNENAAYGSLVSERHALEMPPASGSLLCILCACTAIHPQGFGWGVMLFQWTLPSPELLCGKINGILPKETNKKPT